MSPHRRSREELTEYRRKRSFDKTPEPRGEQVSDQSRDRFVIQEHHARRLHWDLRLERDGVLASWALPRGLPETPDENRLAVHTEDHPLEYLTFEAEIPAGEYGGGKMTIWDHGTYEAEKFDDTKVVFRLYGERASGRFALFQTRDDDWLIHRMDPPDHDREPTPSSIAPMTATRSKLPDDQDAWAFEIRWDGVRVLAYADPGRLRLVDAEQRDVTRQYPELRALSNALGYRHVVLDGEIVAFGDDGRPSPERAKERAEAASDTAVRRAQRTAPVVYVIVDLLYLDDRSLLEVPYEERRRQLAELALDGPNWQVPDYQRGDGETLLAAAKQQGLTGVVAKRLDSAYQPGRRTRDWLEIRRRG